jgi:hypothetical protein
VATLYLDEDVAHQLGSRLRIAGHTVHTTHQHGRTETSDGNQLLFAAANGWTIITHNRKDFELLHDAWLRWTSSWNLRNIHHGILIISQRMALEDNATAINTLLPEYPNPDNQLFGYDIATHSWRRYDITERDYRPLL